MHDLYIEKFLDAGEQQAGHDSLTERLSFGQEISDLMDPGVDQIDMLRSPQQVALVMTAYR